MKTLSRWFHRLFISTAILWGTLGADHWHMPGLTNLMWAILGIVLVLGFIGFLSMVLQADTLVKKPLPDSWVDRVWRWLVIPPSLAVLAYGGWWFTLIGYLVNIGTMALVREIWKETWAKMEAEGKGAA